VLIDPGRVILPSIVQAHEIAGDDDDVRPQCGDAAKDLEQEVVAHERADVDVAEMRQRPSDQWRR
jgi:hypothetical protein